MRKNTHNSTIGINESTPKASHKDAVTSTESHPSLDVEQRPTQSVAPNIPKTTYASFYWLLNYIKLCLSRLANDVYTSFMTTWFPGYVLLPPHVLHLMQMQDRLRAERESHTVTYSRYKLINHSSLKSANERSTQTISLIPESALRRYH